MKIRPIVMVIALLAMTLTQQTICWSQTAPGDDFDGDGIINSIDIDDDNDGVPDADEAPLCFYTPSEAGILAKVSTGLTSSTVNSVAVTMGNDIPTLHDGTSTTVAASNHVVAAGQTNTTSSIIYRLEYPTPVKLTSVSVIGATASWGTGSFAVLEGSVDGVTFNDALSAPLATSAGTTKTWTVTLNTNNYYQYYRIRVSTVGSTTPTFTNYEVSSILNTGGYIASAHPKPSCSTDTDGDGITNNFDRDSDGDNASDALEAGATASTTANFQFPDVDANNDGLVDAVDANNDGVVGYTSSYYPNAVNNQMSPLFSEICNDGIDNDADGMIDSYDSDCNPLAACASAVTISNFEIQQQVCTSTGSYSNYQTPMVADVDRDGMPDIIAFNDANNSISVINTTTLAIKFSVANPDGNFGSRPNSLAVGQLDGAGYLEIAYVSSNNKLVVLRYNGTTWQSFISAAINTTVISAASSYSNGTGIADFDEDGTPEIYIGNQIFSVNFSCSVSPCITNAINGMVVGTAFGDIGVTGGGFSFAYDVLPPSECSLCAGLELVAGNQVYAVNAATGQVQLVRNFTGAPDASVDGPSAIADVNLDGLIDVVVSNTNGSIYAWTPQTNQLLRDWTGSGTAQRPIPFIANVYNDDLADDGVINNSAIDYPEIIALVGSTLTAYNLSSTSPLYTLSTSDASAATSMVAFDFNGDGNKEIVYRDQSNMRIIYGGPIAYAPAGVDAERNYAVFNCSSGTGWEHPIVADIDDDGEAEIVGSCGTSICIFSSSNYPWMPARPIWNQLSYNVVNVNDDGSIPVHQQNILTSFNGAGNQVLNAFNNQLNPLEVISPDGQIATPDIYVSGAGVDTLANGSADCSNLQIHYQITNSGSATMANNIYVYVYDKDPTTQANATLIYQTFTTQNIPADSTITQSLHFGIPATSYPVNTLYIAVNTNPNMTVLVDATDFGGSFPECNYSNNIFAMTLPGCSDTDGDGITDVLDIDDDNDGVLDAVESPACFYNVSEAIVPVKVSTGLTSSTVNSAAVTAGNNIPTLFDNTTTTVAASDHIVAATQLANTTKIIYKVQYPTAIGLTQMAVYTATASWGTGSFSILEASNDDVNYVAVSAPVATSAGNPKIWPVTLLTTNLYRYYRIRVSTVGSTQPTFTNFEVAGTLNAATYNPSANPKPITCSADTDGDGIPNHRDTDSDGDGCSDALESGATTNTTANYQFSCTLWY
ncbi:MAG: VCBS repeat-containing protein [Chitinophagaceae bacterium]